MGRSLGFNRVAIGIAALALGGCFGDGGGSKPSVSRGSFQVDYLSARGALDSGAYDKAQRRYADLLPQSGPATARVRLEYAHALLRAGKYSDAATAAYQSAAESDGLARASALAVQGISEHEMARASMAKGTFDRTVLQQLNSAGASLDLAIAAGPQLDPMGGLQARRGEISIAEQQVRQRMGG
jgi:thioredoxin-like negative regulator of GroEL